MSESGELLERFRCGSELVSEAISGAGDAEVDFKPTPDKWTMRQILAHLSDSELVAGMRFRSMIAEDSPRLEAFDQDKWAQHLDYEKRDPMQALEMFCRLRAQSYELLRDLPETAFDRQGIHSERGPITLRAQLRTMTLHAESHAAQIRARRDECQQRKDSAQ
jgi:hypothetical protein